MAYATRADLAIHGLPSAVLAQVATASQDAVLDAASDEADSYLRKRYGTPLSTYGVSLTRHVCAIASYDLAYVLGVSPEDVERLEGRANIARKWLRDCALGMVEPVDASDDATPSVAEGAPLVSSADIVDWDW